MTNAFSLTNKSALITGGAQGLGEHLAERLAQEGAAVAIADLQAEQASALASRLAETYGVATLGLAMNVTDEAQVAAGFDAAVAKFGKLDICVANAGILKAGALTDFDPAVWRQVIEVDLVGYMIAAKHATRVMLPQGSGSIIQINSKSGRRGSSKNSAYAAAKFGGIGLTQSLGLELAEAGVRVNAICPGNLLDSPLWVTSLYKQYAERWGITEAEVRQRYIDQVPMKRGCRYEDVANVMVFLASEASSYMTGQAINVTGGQVMD
jgi:sorbitol-6-phosphate 2-dehydrogenase